MWEHEDNVETSAAPDAIWDLFIDVAGWPRWNADIERIEIDGPFGLGAVIAMKPAGQDTIRMRIVEVRDKELFTDEVDIGDAVVRTTHRLRRIAAGRTRITYRTEITGPAAERIGPQLGPAITHDFPDVLAALVKLAEG